MGGDPRPAARGLLASRSVAILLAAAREALAKQAKAAQDARANLSSLGYLELKCLIEIYNKRQQRFDIYETDDHAMALVHKGILNVVGRSGSGVLVCEVNPAIEQLVGNTIERLHADAGYRGHNAPPDYKLKIYTSKQKRRVTPTIKREMRRRSAIEPVIGHLKNEHRMERNYLADREGDANNAILAAVGYNFRRLIKWLRFLWWLILVALCAPPKPLSV
jgi:hypothetical protein